MASYVTWANKGGIGKSTLSFQLAVRHARQYPDKVVVVIDMSPQCDVSRMLLGGGHFDGEQKIIDIMTSSSRRTIYRYLEACVNDVPSGRGWPDSLSFLIDPNTIRAPESESLPENIKLVCGDFDLERVTYSLDNLPQPQSRGGRVPSGAHYSSYLLPRTFLRKMVEDFEEEYEDVTVFIDTDPYYSVVTTHLGLLAADKLISAYSPSSQASQYAIYRSLEFLYDSNYGLVEEVRKQELLYPKPWFDNANNIINTPTISVAELYLVISNMNTPQGGRGLPPYHQPQHLHRQAIDVVTQRVNDTLGNLGLNPNHIHDYMWDLKRLGLVCDYNGFDLATIQLGQRYAEPSDDGVYYVNTTGGTPIQLSSYNDRLDAVSAHL
ncbi:ParA family protein [Klebsiella quasipneumoniae]|uniref:ParA family protein n=1 Tax=Klebsiella quasipneumoniae TaxID=1463165 RepID=UPI000F61CDFC|nr:AAA family ATPase [Klebsiella quasipneumoniae]RRF80337.1 ParA family protein [Klebsiella quasipneumoniae]